MRDAFFCMNHVDGVPFLLFWLPYGLLSFNKQYMQDVVSDSYKGNPKKFWSYIKSTGNKSTEVSPLKNEDGFLKSDNQSKAKQPV